MFCWLIRAIFSEPSGLGAKFCTRDFCSGAPKFWDILGICLGHPATCLFFKGFRGTYQTFWRPPLYTEDPHPTLDGVWTQEFVFVFLFLPSGYLCERAVLIELLLRNLEKAVAVSGFFSGFPEKVLGKSRGSFVKEWPREDRPSLVPTFWVLGVNLWKPFLGILGSHLVAISVY